MTRCIQESRANVATQTTSQKPWCARLARTICRVIQMDTCLNQANVVTQQYPLGAMRQLSDTSLENQQYLHILTPQQVYLAMHGGSMTGEKSWDSRVRKQHSDELHRLALAVRAAETPMDQQ